MRIVFCNDVDEGGSASYVYNMAEECRKRGHNVKVLTETGDISILDDKWDLVIVHGITKWQNKCIQRAHPNKLLWLAIRPTYNEDDYKALETCDYVGCATHIDYDFTGYSSSKVKKVRHGIPVNKCKGKSGFKEKYGIKGKMFFSAGGYFDNKGMEELIDMFEEADLTDTTLVTTGYAYEDMHIYESQNVVCLHDIPYEDVLSGMYEAELYISNAYSEGFGLCLLETMANHTPWIAKDGWYGDKYHVGAVKDLVDKGMGISYTTKEELISILRTKSYMGIDVNRNYNILSSEYDIKNTVDNIEEILASFTVNEVYCINIRKRPDRLENAKEIIKESGMDKFVHNVEFTTNWENNLDAEDITDEWLKEKGFGLFDWEMDEEEGMALEDGYWSSCVKWWARPLNRGEMGCTISHSEIWKRARGYTLVLEDDLLFHKNWKIKLHNAIETLNHIDKEWDLLYLGREPQLYDSEEIVTDSLRKPLMSYCTFGYLISPSGREKLLNYEVEKGIIPADEFLTATYNSHPRPDVKFKYPPTLIAYSMEPSIVYQDLLGSDTETGENPLK